MRVEGGRKVPIEVVYALPARQIIRLLTYCPGMTAGSAVLQSGLCDDYAEVKPHCALACFGRRIDWNDLLQDGDRVEILRSLLMDSKALRRRRARLQAARKKKS